MEQMHYRNAMYILSVLPFTEEERELLKKAADRLSWGKWEVISPLIYTLTHPDYAEDSKNKLYELIREEDEENNGLCGVCVFASAMHQLAVTMYPKGVSKDVLRDTFGALKRMMDEYKMQHHRIGFQEGFWVWRQCCGQILRLGTLEFEYLPSLGAREAKLTGLEEGKAYLSVHIPCGADMSREALDASYAMARTYFAERPYLWYGGGGAPQGIICHTWLLSVALTDLLKPDSGIRRFAGDYRIVEHEEEGKDCIHFLFRVASDTPYADLPEDTSLRRAVKQHLLSGKGIGTGLGVLKI